MTLLLSLLLAGTSAWFSRDTASASAFAPVQALFDLSAPSHGPFPSDWFTAAEPGHNTGRQVDLPYPNCDERPSDCEDIAVINTLDGFNLQPRLSIPFDGPIDVQSATSQSVFLISLGSTLGDGHELPSVVGINQIVWDPETNTLHVESDELLDQHTRYALIVTRAVRDETGTPVEATEAFRRFRQAVRGEYKHALLEAIHAARRLGVREEDIAVASVFTTQSVTAVLEKIRDQIKEGTPAPADFNLGPGGTRTVFPLETLTRITWRQQTEDNPPGFTTVLLDLNPLRIIPGAVGQIAFGKYASPDYMTADRFIPEVGTRTGEPVVQRINELYFNLFIPSGPKPEGGWPVAIHSTGGLASKDENLFVIATMAQHGIATITLSHYARGFGPLGTLTVNHTGGSVTFPSGGRGIDADHDHVIGASEGEEATPPRTILMNRDAVRQTVVDLMQLVRVIEVGMDVDGDSVPDLDSTRIYHYGWSFGGRIGTILLALDPDVRAGAEYAPGGLTVDNMRLVGRQNLGPRLQNRTPSLLNSPGIDRLDGIVAVMPPHFNDNMPLRSGAPFTARLTDGTSYEIRSPMINTVAGAMDIQRFIKNTEWVSQSGNMVAYGPHLRRKPLMGVPAKSLVVSFGSGDRNVPHPVTTALIRAGDLADLVTYYRHDLFPFAEYPTVGKNPHTFMNNVAVTFPQLLREIAFGAQRQIAVFFASDGKEVIHPEPARFFEVPIELPLPEGLHFIP